MALLVEMKSEAKRKSQKALLIFAIALLIFSCRKEPEPIPESTIGHLVITATYPEPIIDEDGLLKGYGPVPGAGVTAKLFQSDAKLAGYKDACFGIAWTDEKPVQSIYSWTADSSGIINLFNIRAGEYYLALVSRRTQCYTEKIISIGVGDTIRLHKDFTNYSTYWEDLEPWEATMYK